MNLETYTFGGSHAAETLVKILNASDDRKSARKVANFLKRINVLMTNIDTIPDPWCRKSLAALVEDNIQDSSLELPPLVKSYMKNVAVGRVRRSLDAWREEEQWESALNMLDLFNDTPDGDDTENSQCVDTHLDYAPEQASQRQLNQPCGSSSGVLSCTCPSGDGSLRWPCPTHPPDKL